MFFDLANVFLPYLGVLPSQLEEMAKRCQHFQVLKGEKLKTLTANFKGSNIQRPDAEL